ncbi:MAG: serine hydrolase domain-containing protein [Ignavibacteriota bacterium]
MHRFTRREFGALAIAAGVQARRLFAANGIDAALRSGMEQRKIPAVVAMAGNAGGVTYSGAFGTRDAASKVPVNLDSIFAIASMTKAVTSVGAMQLVEQGKLTLDEPASKHLPELGKLQVLDGFDGAGKAILRPPAKPVTLRQLLTHTSGFAYDTWHEAMFKFTAAGGDPTHVLAFEPGTKWQYGPSTFWAGRLVEAVSGMDPGEIHAAVYSGSSGNEGHHVCPAAGEIRSPGRPIPKGTERFVDRGWHAPCPHRLRFTTAMAVYSRPHRTISSSRR